MLAAYQMFWYILTYVSFAHLSMWLGLPSLVMSKVGFTQLRIGCFQPHNCQGCLSDIVPSIAAAGRNRTVKKLSAHGEALMAEGALLDRGGQLATGDHRVIKPCLSDLQRS